MGINKNLATWNMTKNSLSSSSTQKIKDAFIVYSKYMNFNYFKSFYFTLILSLNFVIKYFLINDSVNNLFCFYFSCKYFFLKNTKY